MILHLDYEAQAWNAWRHARKAGGADEEAMLAASQLCAVLSNAFSAVACQSDTLRCDAADEGIDAPKRLVSAVEAVVSQVNLFSHGLYSHRLYSYGPSRPSFRRSACFLRFRIDKFAFVTFFCKAKLSDR